MPESRPWKVTVAYLWKRCSRTSVSPWRTSAEWPKRHYPKNPAGMSRRSISPLKPAPISEPWTAKPRCGCRRVWPRFLETDAGNVKQLQGIDPPQYRLRIGDWRFIFRHPDPDTIEVLRVRNRREAYR